MKPHKKSYDFPISKISKDTSLDEKHLKNESKEPLWKCRYVIVLVVFYACVNLMYVRLNMSISIVAMVNNSAIIEQVKAKSDSCPSSVNNSTEEEIPTKMLNGEFNWSQKIQGYILGSYFFGYVATQLPTGLLAERYGCKWFLFGATLVTGICTLLIPPLSYLGASALIVLQVLRGLAQGLFQPASFVLASNWLPNTERGFLTAFMNSGGPLGSCLGSIFTGYLCESVGRWPASFYLTGAGGLLLAALVLFFTAENPKVHPRISKAELDYILSNQENPLLRKRPKLPWRKILKSVPVYALAYAIFGQAWAMSQFWTVHSTFLSTILHYPIGQNGLLTAATFFLQFLGSQIAAWISLYLQKKKIANADFLRKFWNLTASMGVSACTFGMYMVGCNRTLSAIFAILSMGCTGIGIAGCWIAAADMSPTFAGTVHAIACSLGSLSSCLLPVVTGYLTDGMQTIEQWNKVFFLTIGVVMSSGIVFALFGSADIQPWNFVEDETTVEDNKLPKTNEKNAEKNEMQTRF